MSRQDSTPAAFFDELVRRACTIADAAGAVRRHGAAVTADLARFKTLTLIAVGKAAAGMGRAAIELLGPHIDAGIIVVPKEAIGNARDAGPLPRAVITLDGDHPKPASASVLAGGYAAELAARAARRHDHAVVLLISGGASAMMASPRTGLTLEDLADVADKLMRSGASIAELNTVRRRLDRLKGGGLARLAAPTPVFTYAISDVLGDDLRTIGSGPGVPDDTTDADALEVLRARGVLDAVPTGARLLGSGAREIDGPLPVVGAARVLMNNAACLEALGRDLADFGNVVEIRPGVAGEARDAARTLCERLRSITPGPRPRLVLWGGETTVTVRGGGRGGRNQEFALAAALHLNAVPAFHRTLVASFGTDGVDGNTPVAGAFVAGHTAQLAAAAGLDPAAALEMNDSHTFFDAFEARVERALIRTGPTGTNVNDIMLGVIGPV